MRGISAAEAGVIAGLIAIAGVYGAYKLHHPLQSAGTAPPPGGLFAEPGATPTGNGNVAGVLQQGVLASQVTVALEADTLTDFPDFEQHEFTVNTRDVVSLTFRNRSLPQLNYRHDWVLVKPGTAAQIERQAEHAGRAVQFLPNSPDLLAATDLLPPGQSETILFRAPSTPGDYPFICTFPGHAAKEKGVLHVKAD